MSKTRPTTLPGFPKVPIALPPEVRKYLEALSEVVEIRVGRRGDPRDRAITLRELIDSGLALELEDSPFDPNAYNENDLGFVPAGDGVGGVMTPTVPTNFTVNALFETVNLSFDFPTYIGHSQTQIWRHTSDSITSAVNIGNVRGRFYVDNVGGGQTHYYWIRHENVRGVVGPWNSASGTVGTTLQNVTFLLNGLANQITNSQLASSLSSQITAIGQIPVWSTSNAYVVGDVVRTNDGAGADRLYVCIQNVNANTVGLGNASYWKIYGAYDELKSATDTATAAITAINTVTTGSGSAAAVAIAQATARLNDVDGDSGGVTIETRMAAQATTNSGHSAQYTVKIDNNNHIAGFGLASTTVNSTPTSAFIVSADKFAVIDPSNTSVGLTNSPPADAVPFVISSGSTFIKSAMIADASITNAKINDLNAAKINAGTISADRIGANSIEATKLILDSTSLAQGNVDIGGQTFQGLRVSAIDADNVTITNLKVDNLSGDVNTIEYHSGSGSRQFGPTSAEYVELSTFDCDGNSEGKTHRPTLNIIFSARFENDTASVKVEVATVTGGSVGSYSTVQELEHFCGGVSGANTTIPVIAAMNSNTTSDVRFKVSIKMFGDQGSPNTTSASNTGTANWRGYTVGLV